MNFSEKVKALRDRDGLKQSDLAAKSGLTTNKVQRYEQANQKPKGDDALALAKALGVTADYLLDDSLPFPPPEEFLSEKVVIIRKLEGLIAALTSRAPSDETTAEQTELPDVIHLPVFKLGAGFDISFDAAGLPEGHRARDMYFNGLGDGKFLAAELCGSSMRGPGDTGFALGEILVFREVGPDELASGDYVYVRTDDYGLFRQVFVHGEQLRLRALNAADPEVIVEKQQVRNVARLVRRIKEY